MAISSIWTATDDLEVAVDDLTRASWANGVLGNLQFLYASPRVTLRRTDDLTGIAPNSHVVIPWQQALVDVGGWWDSGSPTVAVFPRDGLYLITTNILWDQPEGGNFRQVRFLRNGDPARGDARPGGAFTEHSLTSITAVSEGVSLSVDVRHNHAGTDRSILARQSPAPRSPLLMAVWLGPLDSAF